MAQIEDYARNLISSHKELLLGLMIAILVSIFFIVAYSILERRWSQKTAVGRMQGHVWRLKLHWKKLREMRDDLRYAEKRTLSPEEIYDRKSDYTEARFDYIEFLYAGNSFWFVFARRGKKDIRWLKENRNFVSPRTHWSRYDTLLEKLTGEMKKEKEKILEH